MLISVADRSIKRLLKVDTTVGRNFLLALANKQNFLLMHCFLIEITLSFTSSKIYTKYSNLLVF